MDFEMQRRNNFRRSRYMSMMGRIVSVEPAGIGNRMTSGCMMRMGVETETGENVNIMVTPATYVVDFTQLEVGMDITFFYRADAPMLLIYPPQYNAAVIAPQKRGSTVFVGRFNNSLVSDDGSLRLNLNNNVPVVTTNNQTFMGNPANRDLVVIYSTSTRSIPAQTTPEKVVVLCDQN